jgi:hypothetical protein
MQQDIELNKIGLNPYFYFIIYDIIDLSNSTKGKRSYFYDYD